MPFMEQVREIGAEEARLTDDEIGTARMALSREIGRATRTADQRAHRGRWIGIGGLVSGGAAAAIVVGSVLIPMNTPSASAAEVLAVAAEATVDTRVLEPAPGQYIRIEEISFEKAGWSRSEDSASEGNLGDPYSATSVTWQTATALYIPADRSEDWIVEGHYENLDATGPDAAAAREEAEKMLHSAPEPRVIRGGYEENTGITAEGVEPDDVLRSSVNPMACYYDEMPRDPEALISWVEEYEYEYGAHNTCPPPLLTDPYGFNLAPVDLRVAMLGALALLEGSSVVKEDGDITTIAFPDGGESNWMETIDVDTREGIIVGQGSLDSEWSKRIEVSIVDSAP